MLRETSEVWSLVWLLVGVVLLVWVSFIELVKFVGSWELFNLIFAKKISMLLTFNIINYKLLAGDRS